MANHNHIEVGELTHSLPWKAGRRGPKLTRFPQLRQLSTLATVWICILLMSTSIEAGSGRTALLKVNLVNLDDGSIDPDRVVLLRDGQIESVFAADIGSVPPRYDVVAVQGLYLLPAYVDMSLQLGLVSRDGESPEEILARDHLARDLYRSGVLISLVPGAPMDSAATLSDSLIRVATGSILEAPSGLPSRWPSPQHVALINEQVPMPSQLRYIIPPEVPAIALGVHIPASLCRRIAQSALGQGLGVVTPAATLHCGAKDALKSGADVVEGVGLLALGQAYSGGLGRMLDDEARKEMTWELWKVPTAPHMLSRVLDHMDSGDLDSLAARILEVEDLVKGIEPLPALCPELTFLEGLLGERGYQGALVDSLLELMSELHREGMDIVVGSGGLGPEAYYHEIELLGKAGIPTLEILRAACVSGAVVVGRPDPSRLQAGAPADLVIVEGDPIGDPMALQRVRYVIRAGRAVPVSDRTE